MTTRDDAEDALARALYPLGLDGYVDALMDTLDVAVEWGDDDE